MTVIFHLEGCRSLKEKRRRLSGLRPRFGRKTHLAVCESGDQDDHRRAEWTFVALGSEGSFVERVLQNLEDDIEQTVDAEIVDIFVDLD